LNRSQNQDDQNKASTGLFLNTALREVEGITT